MKAHDQQHQGSSRDVANPFGDHAAPRSGSSGSSSSRSSRSSNASRSTPSRQHIRFQRSYISNTPARSNSYRDRGTDPLPESSIRDFVTVAPTSRQPPHELQKRPQSKAPMQSENLSREPLRSNKGKAPERATQDPFIGIASTTPVPYSSSSSQSMTTAGQLQSNTPRSLLNEKTEAEVAGTVDPKVIKRGQRKVWLQKQLLTTFDFSANFMLIFSSWYWAEYYYIYLPFISLPLVLNCIMIFMIIIYSIKNMIFTPKKNVPATPETMVLLMPCYNETLEECTRSLNSLTGQINIDRHKKAIMIVCDGKVRGPGMDKTTAQYLAEDILASPKTERFMIRAAYLAWDGQTMDVECLKGIYNGIPFFCINKQQNQGKRDSLIVSRSFVYNFNRRAELPKVVFAPVFFEAMADWLQNDAEFDRVDVLIGMDADTVFDDDCISHLVTESHYPNTVGVCGYVAVDFLHGNWNLWSIYQSAEYTIAQALRRLHQSMVTHKVSCLPGCCQLLKVCEETCGDRVLIDLFGYHPKPMDGLIRRIRATASEDRNHVCLMLMENPKAQTRQALRARAYTDVPHGARVFLSQRRRWTLGATSNDLMLFTRAPWWSFNWWERIVAFSNVLTWLLNPFVIASLGCMIYAFLHQPWWIILVFASIMIIPLVYYLTMVIWMPRNAVERCQFLLGLSIFTICGPFINIAVTVYALWNSDNFGWGKTRKVIVENGEDQNPNTNGEQRHLEETPCDNEKVIGSQVPDVENQLNQRAATPFTAEPPKLRRKQRINGAQADLRGKAKQQTTGTNSYDLLTQPRAGNRRPGSSKQIDDRTHGAHEAYGTRISNSSSDGRSSPQRAFHRVSPSARRSAENRPIGENLFEVRPLSLSRDRYSDASLNFRIEDFRTR